MSSDTHSGLGGTVMFEYRRALPPLPPSFSAEEQESAHGLSCMELKIRMTLVVDPDTCVFVPVRLYFKNTDPYAVHFSFDVTPDYVVQWTFARELLAQGLSEPVGIGDVKIT